MKNLKVVFTSLVALGFMVLTFTIDWLFIIPAVILVGIGYRELMR